MEKRRDIRNFYVDETFIPIYEKFKKIAATEGKSISDKIRELLIEYVRLHEPGNPQQRLDTVMRLGQAYRANQCSQCFKEAVFYALHNGKRILYCEEHFWEQPWPGGRL